jgi:hypothetical protein
MTTTRPIDKLFESDFSPAIAPSADQGSRPVILLYAVTVFASAFLLFLVEPVIAKLILPWFGGMPAVWTTCLLFFQGALFGGYAYAHLVSARLKPRMQAAVHGVLLAAACLTLPIIPSDSWKPMGDEEPVTRILLVLCATVGLPFFVLSSTGPLLQRWFSRTQRGGSAYRLYALSNAGSLLALLSYPVGFEWLLGSSTTARIWSLSFAVFAVLCGGCGWIVSRLADGSRPQDATEEQAAASDAAVPSPSWGTRLLWFTLAMVPSVLLLATTNAVCQDVASVPFLWILPLSLYLLSFILCFDSERWYSRVYVMPAAVGVLACESWLVWAGSLAPIALQIFLNFLALFLCAMFCHGELVRRRPHVSHLTSFYLLIAAGGAAGGIFVGVIAPRIFVDYYELQIGLFACAALMLVVLGIGRRLLIGALLLMGLGFYGVLLYRDAQAKRNDAKTLAVDRNFYGVLRVFSDANLYQGVVQPFYVLQNGRIMHGLELLDPALAQLPTTYYGHKSGVGRVLSLPSDKPRHVGLIGLGVGTLAAYARPGDHYRYYEINAKVEWMARRYFHYLDHCKGDVKVVHGDARLELDRESPQNFDVLVVDAFSGDAIPVHLLTVEAFGTYLRHLAPQGMIAVHISNNWFALRPVVDAIADVHRLATACISDAGMVDAGKVSLWVLVARDPKRLETAAISKAALPASESRVLWTDDYASLFAVWASRNGPTLNEAPSSAEQRELSVMARGPQQNQLVPIHPKNKKTGRSRAPRLEIPSPDGRRAHNHGRHDTQRWCSVPDQAIAEEVETAADATPSSTAQVITPRTAIATP